jgi:hypothetical protein
MLYAAIHVDFEPQIMLWINVIWMCRRFQAEDAVSTVEYAKNMLIDKNDIIFALYGIPIANIFYTLTGLNLLTYY